MKTQLYAAGRMRTVNFPSVGSYELVSGLGYDSGIYAKSAWAYACMNLRATSLAQIPWYIKRNEDVLENHPLAEMLQRFGQEQIAATEFDMCLKGAAYWLKGAEELVRLNPNTMQVLTSTSGISGFKQTVTASGKTLTRTFAPEQIVYFREFHPEDDLGPGVAAIDIAKPAILAEYEARRFVRSFFENDAIPGLLLTTPQEVPQGELDKLRAWWDEKFRGARNHHKVAFVDRDLSAQILTTDLTSMALSEVLDQARKDICAAFQVPDILVGNMTESTYANAAEARQFLMEEVILPRADYYQDTINKQWVEPYDMTVALEFAYDELEILQEDTNAKADRLIKLLGVDAVDLVYLRDELGIPQDAGPSPEEVEAKKEQARQDMQAQMQEKAPAGDMAKWRKKAIHALKATGSASVPFSTTEIAEPLQVAMRARLEQATTVDEVNTIFALDTPMRTKATDAALTTLAESMAALAAREQVVKVDVVVPPAPAPVVNVRLPKQLATRNRQTVHRDKFGQIDHVVSENLHEYEGD